MTHKENIMAILECYFAGFKKELIDSACERILEQESCGDNWSTGWIPVSERLPEDNKPYLVTVELTFARGERYVMRERKVNWDTLKMCGHEVIAWMPMPEPYKVGDTDGRN